MKSSRGAVDSTGNGTHPSRETFAAGAILTAVVATLYGNVLRLWWTFDDFFCIHSLDERGDLKRYFFSGEPWRHARMFTPVLFLSFQSDVRAFGLRPRLFYLHQLVALAATALALFALLRLWLAATPALLASTLFVMGPPIGSWVQELLVRHYIEGLLCAVLSAWAFVKAARGRRTDLALASAALYLVAMLAKEVYVPLLALVLVLPEERFTARFRRACPHVIALLLYLAGRYAILGTVLGGYGWTIRREEVAPLIVKLPAQFAASLLGTAFPANALLAVAVGLGVGAALRLDPRAAPLFLTALGLVAAPVFTVSKAFHPRYAGLAWLALAVTFGFGCQALLDRKRGGRAVVLIGLLAIAAALVANRIAWRTDYARAERGSAEGRAFLEMKDGELLRHPSIPPAAMKELRWFKEVHLGRTKGAGWFDDDLYLCAPDRIIPAMREYDPVGRSVVDVTSRLSEIRAGYCGALRNAPLRAAVWRENDALYWDLGPYEAGRYAFVIGDGVERVDVARRDGYRTDATDLTLRVRYEAPDGWVTFSPDLSVDLQAGGRFQWERSGEAR